MAFRGHLWTIYPWLSGQIRPQRPSECTSWETTIVDEKVGEVCIRGELSRCADAERAVVIVHGLGGGFESFYCRAAARRLHALGWTVLNLALRGADLGGTDYYHGALTADVHAAVAALARDHAKVHVLGFSVGGHIALHVACESTEPRLLSVAAISAPLDLAASSAHIDTPKSSFYRRHVLAGCKKVYASVASRVAVPTPVAEVMRVRTLRELDSLTVVPRYDYESTEQYYRHASVAPLLRNLPRPALYVGAIHDPMVPERLVMPYVGNASCNFEMRMVRRGGHVGFPSSLDLGLAEATGLVEQVAGFFSRS